MGLSGTSTGGKVLDNLEGFLNQGFCLSNSLGLQVIAALYSVQGGEARNHLKETGGETHLNDPTAIYIHRSGLYFGKLSRVMTWKPRFRNARAVDPVPDNRSSARRFSVPS